MSSRTNEFVGRKIALMEATGVLLERTDFNALSDGTIIEKDVISKRFRQNNNNRYNK